MFVRLNPWIALPFAVLAMLLAGFAYLAFVRPVSQRTALGTIIGKHFVPAETVVRRQGSPRRESWSEQRFEMPDRYRFEILLEGSAETLTYSLPVTAASSYKLGQRVTVVYETRGIPGIWKRNYVRTISPAATRGLHFCAGSDCGSRKLHQATICGETEP
jgi:hypothetical protein